MATRQETPGLTAEVRADAVVKGGKASGASHTPEQRAAKARVAKCTRALKEARREYEKLMHGKMLMKHGQPTGRRWFKKPAVVAANSVQAENIAQGIVA